MVYGRILMKIVRDATQMHFTILNERTLTVTMHDGRCTCKTITTVSSWDLKTNAALALQSRTRKIIVWFALNRWYLTCPMRYTYVDCKSFVHTINIKNERTFDACTLHLHHACQKLHVLRANCPLPRFL